MTRNARAWRAGMVTTGAAVNPIKTAALYRVSPAGRFSAKDLDT